MKTRRLTYPFSWGTFIMKVLLTLILMEAFLGGGGRVFDFGLLSLRMYLFIGSLALALAAAFTMHTRFNKYFIYLLLAHLGMLLLSSLVGACNDATAAGILNDVKPLLSFCSLLFLALAIRSEEDVLLVKRILVLCAVIMALTYLLVFALINVRLVPFYTVYRRLVSTEEFFFRGNFAFFYKGFLYMGVGAFFIAEDWRKKNKVLFCIVVLALVLTFTRGFLVSLLVTYFFYLAVIRRRAIVLIVATTFLLVVGASVWEFVSMNKRIDRVQSDKARFTQVQEVFARVTPVSTVIGHGFGIGVPSRMERMEIAYLEIFHKQGIVGLLFWVAVFALSWKFFQMAVACNRGKEALPFMLSVFYIGIQSFTNPFVNNPIGIMMINVSLVSINVLINFPRETKDDEHASVQPNGNTTIE